MSGKDTVEMSQRELKRASIVSRVVEGLVKQTEAAEILGLSYRQTKRLVVRVREEGDSGVIHRLRGKPGNRRIQESVKAEVLRLCGEQYHDFGPTFASEKLREVHRIQLSDETLRLWLRKEAGKDWPWQRRHRRHRKRRERKQYAGEMVQLDGSHHDWLEGRGPNLVLMSCVDDATSKTLARFYEYEGTFPAMECFKRYCRRYGLPQAMYLDRLSAYKSVGELTMEEQLRGQEPLSQFARAMKELGVRVSWAGSPQAKGRVERSFGTHQDRLVKEMRLAGVRTLEEANRFLDTYYLAKHNELFAIAPAGREDLHRKAPPEHIMREALCTKTTRAVSNDAVVRHENRFYQLQGLPHRRVRSVVVENHLDGSLKIRHNGSLFKWHEISPPAPRKRSAPRPLPPQQPWKAHAPATDHPWNKPFKRQRRACVQHTTT